MKTAEPDDTDCCCGMRFCQLAARKRIKRIIEFQLEVHKLPNNWKINDFKNSRKNLIFGRK
jgi:hypothetical protein